MKTLGVLDGRDMPAELLRAWAESSDFIIAADGAADRLFEVGVRPHVVVGDMDGMTIEPAGFEVVIDADVDRTDCDKLLRWAGQNGRRDLTLANIEGDLLDHVMSTLSSCAAIESNVRIALRRGIGWVFTGDLEVASTPGARVSLLPVTSCAGVDLSGVKWPLRGAELRPAGFVSISNAASDDRVRASVHSGSAFLFVEYPPQEMPFWD